MRSLFLVFFSALLLTACGGGGSGSSGVAGQTQVTIGLGQSVAVGALGAAGSIPNGIQSMSVTVFS
ncbi:MAG: hypothetical protein Q9M09_01210, partial [Mariprofundaceae bacterium]|nr:hypothetical protein [Mariprofundaceae bacterium]